jgi:dihydrodipicolinate synthase/N-acetylneuraminate lyase
MNLLQLHGGTPRSPLLPLKEEDVEKIRDLLLKLHNFRSQHFGIKGHVIL